MSQTFKPSSFLKPKSEGELAELLQKYGDQGRIIAGGTGIYEVAHRGLISDVNTLIDISGVGLSYVRNDEKNNVIRIGAATTMSNLWGSIEIRRHRELHAIIDALKAIQPLQVKNVASIAGAICTALPFFDLPVALLSIGSSIVIGPSDKKVKLEDFLLGYFSVKLERGEFVREIELPVDNISTDKTASAFQKFGMTADDWALINCGASVALNDQGKLVSSTLFFGGGVGEKPVRAKLAENALQGQDGADEENIKKILTDTLPNELEPISDMRSSAEYRMALAKVLGRRTLITASKRALSPKEKTPEKS